MKKCVFCLLILVSVVFAQDHKIIVDCPTQNSTEFEELARLAAKTGATHVVISHLPKSRWQWELDRSDPYSNWGMLNPALFKIIVPKEFKGLLPQEYADTNLAILKRRVAILDQYGLEAAMNMCEPAWLPERVWQTYPEWRGPRCEHPRRARNKYYSPCVDHPEVLEIYREAMTQLCREVPVEYISMLTNDSGGGFCWSASLYPGANGPTHCKHRPYADRVTGFLSTLQEGAGEAGVDLEISVHYGSGQIERAEVLSVISSLKPGQAVNGKTRTGSIDAESVGYSYYRSAVNPVIGIPQPIRFVRSLDTAYQQEDADIRIFLTSLQLRDHIRLLKQFDDHHGYTGRATLLHAVAADQVGADQAETLIRVWDHISQATDRVNTLVGDPIMLVGLVNQRWLNRPFVPFAMQLTPEEKDYYRPFQFQANSEEDAADLMNLQGFEIINGYSGSLLAKTAFEQAIASISSALSELDAIDVEDAETTAELDLLDTRLRVLRCCYRTVNNAIAYQDILDRTDYENPPEEENIYPVEGSQKLRELQNVTRAEVGNMVELIHLIEDNPGRYLEMAPTPELEDIFIYGPDLVQQLKTKIRTMLDHELDANVLYIRRQG
jgi:hypothetical protein